MTEIKKPNNFFAARSPGSFEIIWGSKAMMELAYIEKPDIPQRTNTINRLLTHIIIRRFYSHLDTSKLPVFGKGFNYSYPLVYQPNPKDHKRYFIFEITLSAEVLCTAKTVPKLTQKDIDSIAKAPYNTQHIASIFKPTAFQIRGISFIYGKEISHWQHLNFLNKTLSSSTALMKKNDLVHLSKQIEEFIEVKNIY